MNETEETDDPFLALMASEDDFRVAIRGFADLEAAIDEGIADSFVAETQPNMREFGGFRTRLALAVALGVVPRDYASQLSALAKIRNDFAHGKIDELTAANTETLRPSLKLTYPDEMYDQLMGAPPATLLRVALVGAHASLQVSIKVAREQRERARRALNTQAEVREALTRLDELTRD
jgi:hypothetical protein